MNNDNFLKIANTLLELKKNVDENLYFRVTVNGMIIVGTIWKRQNWSYSKKTIIARSSICNLTDKETERFITVIKNKLKEKDQN